MEIATLGISTTSTKDFISKSKLRPQLLKSLVVRGTCNGSPRSEV